MDTHLYQHRRAIPPEPAQPDGVYAVADAYRFSTTVTTLLDNGAAYVRPFLPIEDDAIRSFDETHDDAFVRQPLPDKATGIYNSTTYTQDIDVTDRPIGLHSTNGARTVRQIADRHPLYLITPLNASAAATVLKNRHPDETIHLVACGNSSGQEAVEDLATTGLVQAALDGTFDSVERHYDALLSAGRSGHSTNKSTAAVQDYERLRDFNTIQTVPKRDDNGDLIATTPNTS